MEGSLLWLTLPDLCVGTVISWLTEQGKRESQPQKHCTDAHGEIPKLTTAQLTGKVQGVLWH